MSDSDLPLETLLGYLEILANQSLHLWEMVPKGATARLINVSENATYLVEKDNWKSILRIHRQNYHSETAINCELSWSTALTRESEVVAPDFFLGKDGKAVQSGHVDGLTATRHMVMFEFVEGTEPDENADLIAPFEELGEITARTHNHTINWSRPEPFERLTWNLDTVFGENPTWGHWQDAPNVTPEINSVLQRVEETVIRRLTEFGQGPQRYGLIHADMRLANLLIDKTGTRLIDFDDCGDGWFLYDFATATSFMEDHPLVPALKAAWVKGYRKVRALSDQEENEIETFIMMRRLALLAWIGSRIEAPEPQAMAPHFARVSAELGAAYLENYHGHSLK